MLERGGDVVGVIPKSLAADAAASRRLTPLYRLHKSTLRSHLYTTAADERDERLRASWADEGVACYVVPYWVDESTRRREELVPLYRLWNKSRGALLYTANATERSCALQRGWMDEGLAGYVFSAPAPTRSTVERALLEPVEPIERELVEPTNRKHSENFTLGVERLKRELLERRSQDVERLKRELRESHTREIERLKRELFQKSVHDAERLERSLFESLTQKLLRHERELAQRFSKDLAAKVEGIVDARIALQPGTPGSEDKRPAPMDVAEAERAPDEKSRFRVFQVIALDESGFERSAEFREVFIGTALLPQIDPDHLVVHVDSGCEVFHGTTNNLESMIGARGRGARTARAIIETLRASDQAPFEARVAEVKKRLRALDPWFGRTTNATLEAALERISQLSLGVWQDEDRWEIIPRGLDFLFLRSGEDRDDESADTLLTRLYEELIH